MMPMVLLLFALLGVSFADYTPDWPSLDSRPIPSWYEDAKFGIFIHWGVYSVPSYGSEHFWYRWKVNKDPEYVDFMKNNYPPNFEYQDFAPMFKAELWDPAKWATLFKHSGAKYIAFTSKHHEGYTNWPSKYSWNWNSMDVGPGRDIVGELAKAIRNNTGIHLGLYYSLFDFFHPLYLVDKANNFTTQNYVNEVMLPQLHEIVVNYQPDLIWSDGDWDANDTYWDSKEFLAWLYNERSTEALSPAYAFDSIPNYTISCDVKPMNKDAMSNILIFNSPVKDSIVVNDRWGSNCKCVHGGYYTCRNKTNPVYQAHKWENYYPMQKDCWGYNRLLDSNGYATTQELISILVQTISCNGNFLLNVGPSHDGRIMPIFEERLLDIGSWLSINGDAIYGSKPWKFQNDPTASSVWYTVGSDNSLYGIVLDWFDHAVLTLGAFKNTNGPHLIKMLGYDDIVRYTMGPDGVQVNLPITNRKWAITLKFYM